TPLHERAFYADFERVRRFLIEEIADAGDVGSTYAGLIEPADAKPTAIAAVDVPLVRRTVAQRGLRLQIVPSLRAHLTGECRAHQRCRYEFCRRVRDVATMIAVVAERDVAF